MSNYVPPQLELVHKDIGKGRNLYLNRPKELKKVIKSIKHKLYLSGKMHWGFKL